jgi:hypothetical protein
MKTKAEINRELQILDERLLNLSLDLQNKPDNWEFISEIAAYKINQYRALMFVMDTEGITLTFYTTKFDAYKELQLIYQAYVDRLIEK